MNEIRWTDKVYLDSQGNIRTIDGCPTNQISQDLIDKVNTNVGLMQPIKDERPQGEWIGNAFDEHHCNRCGHPALWEEELDGYYEVQSRFCPNCGAKMQKGGKEE